VHFFHGSTNAGFPFFFTFFFSPMKRRCFSFGGARSWFFFFFVVFSPFSFFAVRQVSSVLSFSFSDQEFLFSFPEVLDPFFSLSREDESDFPGLYDLPPTACFPMS